MPDKDEIEQVIQALWAIYELRNNERDRGALKRRIIEIARSLDAADSWPGKYGGIRRTVADAITKTYLIQPLAEIRE